MTRLVVLIGTLLVAVFLVACGGDDEGDGGESSSDPYKIGLITSRTGPVAGESQHEVAGAEIAVDEINAAGGVNGRQLELVVVDDKTDAQEAGRVARELVIGEGVSALTGGTITTTGLAISQAAANFEVPFMASSAMALTLTEGEGATDWTFRAWSNQRTQIEPPAKWAAETGAKRVALITPNTEYGLTSMELFKERLLKENPDAEIVIELTPEVDETDYSSFVNRLNNAEPELIWSGVSGANSVTLIKQLRNSGGMDDVQYVTYFSQTDLETLGKTLPDGVRGYNAFYISVPEVEPEAQAFVDAGTEKGVNADGTTWASYVAIKWLAQAIEDAGGDDPQAMVEALSGATLDTPVGQIEMRAGDHQATGAQWMGTTKFDEELGFAVMTDLDLPDASEFLLPEEEAAALRPGQ